MVVFLTSEGEMKVDMNPLEWFQLSLGKIENSCIPFTYEATLKQKMGPLDWATSTRLSTNTNFEFQTSDVFRAFALHVGFR